MKPRLLRLFVLMAVLVVAFIWLGRWQWHVAHNKADRQQLAHASSASVEPLDKLLKPETAFNNELSLRRVSARGVYDPAHTQLVAGRRLDGVNGYWLITPLVVDTTHARLVVLRGFVTKTTDLPAVPSGQVTVTGALAPGESPSQMGSLPDGQIGAIDLGLLLNQWGGSVYNGFIFMTAQTPKSAQTATVVKFIPPPVPHSDSLNLQNAVYAIQWWVFAGFAAFVWVKMVRDEHELELLQTDSSDDETASANAGKETHV